MERFRQIAFWLSPPMHIVTFAVLPFVGSPTWLKWPAGLLDCALAWPVIWPFVFEFVREAYEFIWEGKMPTPFAFTWIRQARTRVRHLFVARIWYAWVYAFVFIVVVPLLFPLLWMASELMKQ